MYIQTGISNYLRSKSIVLGCCKLSIITFFIALTPAICSSQSDNGFYYQTDWGIEGYTYNLECDDNQMELYARNDSLNIECTLKIPYGNISYAGQLAGQKKYIYLKLDTLYTAHTNPKDHSDKCFGEGVINSSFSTYIELLIPFYSKRDAKSVYKDCIEEIKKRSHF